MSTRDWTVLQRLRFFALLKEARSLKRHGADKFSRFAFLLGYMSGFDDGGLRGFEQGLFHLVNDSTIEEALECAHKLDAENFWKEDLAEGVHIVAENAIPNSQ